MTAIPPSSATGASISSRMLELTGMVLDERYLLGRRLGIGAMGVVYEATQRSLNRQVAVKLLRGEHTHNETYRRRFEREARSASRIRHPNVVQILDFGEIPDGPLYIVMEYLSGIDLRELLQRDGALESDRARDLLREILQGIGAAHDAGIIHRDIKPANCFLADTPGGPVVKVVDFGVARLEDQGAASALTGISEVVGSVAYVAPEMIMGQTANVRTDIYALGVLAHEILSGVHPFAGKDLYDIMERHLNQPPPPLPSTTAADLRELVTRSLQKHPEARFASVHEMLALLTAERPASRPPSVELPSLRPTGAPRATAVLQRTAPLGPQPTGKHAPVASSGPTGETPAQAEPTHRPPKPVSTAFMLAALAAALGSLIGMLLFAHWISLRLAS